MGVYTTVLIVSLACTVWISCLDAKTFQVNTLFKTNWYKANHHCTWNGMRLATILSEDENNQVKAQINETLVLDDFWIGGTKLGNNPYFYWMSVNKPMITYTDWESTDDNPNYLKCSMYSGRCHHNCLKMVVDGGMHWKNADCDDLNYFVCEETK